MLCFFTKKQQICFRQYKRKKLLKLMLCRFYPSLPDKKMIAFTSFFFNFFLSTNQSVPWLFRIKIDWCFLLFSQLRMLISCQCFSDYQCTSNKVKQLTKLTMKTEGISRTFVSSLFSYIKKFKYNTSSVINIDSKIRYKGKEMVNLKHLPQLSTLFKSLKITWTRYVTIQNSWDD